MDILPREAVEEARIGRERERGAIEFHREEKDISPFVLDVLSVKNRVCYPLAVAGNSLKVYINKLRGQNEQ